MLTYLTSEYNCMGKCVFEEVGRIDDENNPVEKKK